MEQTRAISVCKAQRNTPQPEPERGISIRIHPAFLPSPGPERSDAQTRLSYRPHADTAEKIHRKDPLATQLISMLRCEPRLLTGVVPVAQQRFSQAG